MADYYSILSRTVSGLPANNADNRKLVYAKARAAIDRQLRAINPPPTDDAIARQMESLEAAIERIESENRAAVPVPTAPPQRPVQTPAPQRPAAAPAPAPEARVAAPVQPRPPVREQVPPQQRPATPVPPAASRPLAGSAQPVRTGAPDPFGASRAQPQAPARPAQAPQQVQPVPRPASPRGEPPPYDSSLDAVVDIDRTARPRPSPQTRRRSTLEAPARSSSALTMVVITIFILGLIAGGGYALWRNSESLLALVGMGSEPSSQAQPAADPAADPTAGQGETANADAANGKQDARLGGDAANATDTAEDGTPPPDAATAGQPAAAADTDAASQVPLPGTDAAANSEAQAQAETPQVRPVEDPAANGTQVAAVPQQAETAGAAAGGAATEQANAAPAIGQKAYLYEEGAAGSGATRDDAAVVWTLEQLSPADGFPPEPVIKGKVEVPGRGLVMDITIKRNVDEALPASHIIELYFEAPPDFSGGNIENVARFVMKASEQARGEGLVAVPAKIDTGYFLIALNNLEQAMATNKRLLVESSWIDIPLGYTTKRRALVTLEKGAIGDKVFKEAFAAWDNAPAAASTGQQQ
jgi:hypothetical protein